MSSEVWSCCDLDDSSPVVVVWPFEMSEGKFGSIAVGSEEAEVNEALAASVADAMPFRVSWEECGGGGTNCSLSTAVARFDGHR